MDRINDTKFEQKHFVVYHARNGNVVNIHGFTSFELGLLANERELISETIKTASKITGLKYSQLKALKVDLDQISRGVKYKVDVKNKRLITRKITHNKLSTASSRHSTD
jgi:hypothetical protein